MPKRMTDVIAMIQFHQAIQNYEQVRVRYAKGEINENLWNAFCLECLEVLMTDNKEVLKRLKDM
jgi:hypothetical protein